MATQYVQSGVCEFAYLSSVVSESAEHFTEDFIQNVGTGTVMDLNGGLYSRESVSAMLLIVHNLTASSTRVRYGWWAA